jgi:hypothetical protein
VKRAGAALAVLLDRLAKGVGLDGAFLLIATISIAVGSWFVSTILPWFVVGSIAFIVWLALTMPRRG